MYLVVFVTFVVGLLGLYTQVYTLQAKRMMAKQTAVAQAMMQWHVTAVNLATNAVGKTSYTNLPNLCALSTKLTTGVPPITACQDKVNNLDITVGNGNPPGASAVCIYKGLPPPDDHILKQKPCRTDLPNGFGAGVYAYNFHSIAYYDATSGQSYVLTFVPMPMAEGPAGKQETLVCLPGMRTLVACDPATQKQLPISIGDLLRQMKRSGFAATAYGAVDAAANQLVTQTIWNGITSVALKYPLPAGYSATYLRNGTVGIVTSFQPCWDSSEDPFGYLHCS